MAEGFSGRSRMEKEEEELTSDSEDEMDDRWWRNLPPSPYTFNTEKPEPTGLEPLDQISPAPRFFWVPNASTSDGRPQFDTRQLLYARSVEDNWRPNPSQSEDGVVPSVSLERTPPITAGSTSSARQSTSSEKAMEVKDKDEEKK